MQNLQISKFQVFLFLLLSFAFQKVKAQPTTLVAGDIAFSGYISNTPLQNATEDEFSFVLLKNINNGTVINFTDNGWILGSTNAFRSGETTITWTASTGMSAGAEVRIINMTASTGTLTGTALSLNGPNGDQVLAYQGTVASPTFISAIHTNVYNLANGDPVTTTDALWDADFSGPNASGLPPGLTSGTNAIWLNVATGPENTNGKFNCGGNLSTVALTRAALNNRNNWTKNQLIGPGFTLPTGCGFLAPLPLELVDFKAEDKGGKIQLNWTTANEINNAYFDIEHSSDSKIFNKIGQVKGAGTVNTKQYYSFLSEKPLNGINYYRLKQVDFDGKTDYSNIISIQQKGKSKVKIYPSVTSGELKIEGTDNFVVFNTNGQTVLSQSSKNERTFNLSNLASGIYIVKGLDTEGVNFLEKIMIVK
jgi:Secretion system C-terminal sorting domain